MKTGMKTLCSFVIALLCCASSLSAAQQWKDTIVVSRDGTGDYRTLTEAMEGIRAFMDYKVTVLVKNGVYKEKSFFLPGWRMWISSVRMWKKRLSRTTTMLI